MNFIEYIKEVKEEMKHVAWPTQRQTIIFTIIVIIVSLFTAFYLGIFDKIFTKILELAV